MTTTPDSVDALTALFREALAWGQAYGDVMSVPQWEEMRESKVADLVRRAATQVAAGATRDYGAEFHALNIRDVFDQHPSHRERTLMLQAYTAGCDAALSAPQGANVEENSEERLSAYDHKVIADFLARTGKWVTNDASRDAAIAAAIQADRMERGASAAALSAPQGAQPVPTDDEINALYVETFESAHGVARSAPKAPPLVQKFARAVLSRWATPIAQQAPAAPVAAQGAAERAVPAGMVAVPRVVYEALLGWYDPKGDSMAAVRPLVAAIGDMLASVLPVQGAPVPVASDVSTDQLIELAAHLERQRAGAIAEAVRVMPIGGHDADAPTQFHAGFALACEEVAHRLKTEAWGMLANGGFGPTGAANEDDRPSPEFPELLRRAIAAPQPPAAVAAPDEPKTNIRAAIAAEVATQPAAQVEYLARWLCKRDGINPDQVLDDNPVRLTWHREDLAASRLFTALAAIAAQEGSAAHD